MIDLFLAGFDMGIYAAGAVVGFFTTASVGVWLVGAIFMLLFVATIKLVDRWVI